MAVIVKVLHTLNSDYVVDINICNAIGISK